MSHSLLICHRHICTASQYLRTGRARINNLTVCLCISTSTGSLNVNQDSQVRLIAHPIIRVFNVASSKVELGIPTPSRTGRARVDHILPVCLWNSCMHPQIHMVTQYSLVRLIAYPITRVLIVASSKVEFGTPTPSRTGRARIDNCPPHLTIWNLHQHVYMVTQY